MSATTARELPLVSVVVETVTARSNPSPAESLVDELEPTLRGLERQSYPRACIDAIVVIGEDVGSSEANEITRRFPLVRFHRSVPNYCVAKNAGVAAARGQIVALLDGDCVPEADWLERLVEALTPGIAAVAGRTRYRGRSLQVKTLSVPDFSYVRAKKSGAATGFNINNVAFRREVLRQHPLDVRIRRNGGCVLLYHQLRAAGYEIVYQPLAVTAHGASQIRGCRFIGLHFERGFDGVSLYRLDEQGALRGTRLFRRYGTAALFAITAHRIVTDWLVLARDRRQIGVGAIAVPFLWTVAMALRLVELAGMLTAARQPDRAR